MLGDEAKRYEHDYPDFSYVRFSSGNILKQEALDSAYKSLSGIKGMARKLIAALASLETIAVLTLAGSLLTALTATLYPFLLVGLWAKPRFFGKIFNSENFFDSIAVRATLSLVLAPLLLLIAPIVVTFGSFVLTPQTYTELAVRGLSQIGKTILAATILTATVGLLVLFPPAGVAAIFGAGGAIASTLGLASVTSGALAVTLGTIALAATGLFSLAAGKLFGKLVSFMNK